NTASVDFREALRRDPASPYRWCDLAEALFHENDMAGARYCISRAVSLGLNVPAVLLRAVNMNWFLGNTDVMLTYSQRLIALTAQYNHTIFDIYERMGLTLEQVLSRGLPADSGPAQDYFRHLIVNNRMAELQPVWR